MTSNTPDPFADRIAPGVEFDTPFERGCKATTTPDADGRFDGYDSDGVLCSGFTLRMVTAVHDGKEETQSCERCGKAAELRCRLCNQPYCRPCLAAEHWHVAE